MREDILLKIKPHLIQHLEKNGFVLVDMRFYKNKEGQVTLEILADRASGGITLDECTRLNRELGDVIEATGYVLWPYLLDISSPGVDRPLVTAADFRRALGKDLRVFLKEMVAGKIEYRGILESCGEESIMVKEGTTTIEIPLNKVNKAKQVIL